MRIDRARTLALARLDLGDVLRSRWLVFCLLLYGALAVLFLLVGLRESTVLGFTGLGRVLLSMSHALVLLLPLLSLSATAQVINRAQDDGTLELVFSHPVTRDEYFLGVTFVRYGVLLVPFVALMALVALIGWLGLGSAPAWGFLGRGLVVCSALIWAFTGGGLAVSTFVRNQAKAVMILLGIWVASVALLDFLLIGVMLQWRLNPQSVFVLAALNPRRGQPPGAALVGRAHVVGAGAGRLLPVPPGWCPVAAAAGRALAGLAGHRLLVVGAAAVPAAGPHLIRSRTGGPARKDAGR
ncbi:MAG: ABC transporter permease [bacterium]|nr:ABC transporter permease [bacterium]